ncbi:Cupin domain-containing protein [Maribacter orientalis]|uniref:Cupin domain-containing protein n=1 Tax=Maribacter orientalis TaxID=228957 RepID=A0A1H7JQG5_9FLAO|nr:cupin domain-containing protein [Maribacter orientalis]SEK76752.1 Cupin domain-containing protein [Maribacter orientalis]
MKRKGFFAALLVISTIPMLAFSSFEKMTKKVEKGFKIKSGEGRFHGHIKLKGVNSNILDVKVSGKDTDGDLAIFEQTSLSQGKGTPLHVHSSQDEIFYILEGAYYFQVGEEKYHMAVGDSIFLPRKVPHAWTQKSEKGKMTVILQPAGKLEDFFVTVAALDHEPTVAEMNLIFEKNDMKVIGPPLQLE